MKKAFHEILNSTLQSKSQGSLRAFYREHAFSFSYEYLRKIFSGERIPEFKKVEELAPALGVEVEFLETQASAARLEKKIRQHYQLPASAKLRSFSDKVGRYSREGKIETKILRLVQKLGANEKQQILQYVQFLWNQRRAKQKNPEK